MKRNLIIALMIISTLLIAGCGSKECETRSDCIPPGDCFIASCVKGVCSYNQKPGCTCGDNLCDPKTENPCNCDKDCKPACTGDVGKYMEQTCDDNQNCVTAIKEGKQKMQKPTETIEILDMNKKYIELFGKFLYDEPFNIDASELFIGLQIDSKLDNVRDITVKSVKVLSHTGTYNKNRKTWENDDVVVIADKELDRILWDENMEVNTTVPLKIEEPINESLEKNLWAAFEIEYNVVDSIGREVAKSYEYEKELSFLFVDPTEEPSCPPNIEWDDGNPCTVEKCSEYTDYFVERTAKKSCAGNFICETGEDECSAPADCGPCKGDVGKYLEKACHNGCKTKLKEGVSINSAPTINTKNMGAVTFDVQVGMNRPFNVNKDRFTVELQLIKKGTAEDIKINKLQMIDKATQSLLAEQTIAKGFEIEGSSYTVEIAPLAQLKTSIDGESDKKPSLKLFYKFSTVVGTQTTETVSDTEITLGDVTFINPGVN